VNARKSIWHDHEDFDISYIDYDASVCVPSVGNQIYSTRFVARSGNAPEFSYTPLTPFYGIDLYGDRNSPTRTTSPKISAVWSMPSWQFLWIPLK
jgi:hypothetical protein